MFPIYDENRSATKPFVNYGLIIVNTAIFLYFFMQGGARFNQAIWNYGTIPDFILRGERLWTLLTSMFMHANLLHLFGNMVYLWVFGDNIEDALGHGGYLVFYLLGGLAASFAHIASLYATLPSLGPIGFGIPAVGASGAISAVLGAYLLLYPRARIRTVVFYFFINIVSVPAFFYLGFWFFYQLLLGVVALAGSPSGVAFWAHIGGFVAGVVIIKVFGVRPRSRKFIRRSIEEKKAITPIPIGRLVRKPIVEFITEEEMVRIIAELPGVEERDVEIRVADFEVAISAEHGEMKYNTVVSLPVRVEAQIQELTYRNGVLSFSLPRKT